MCEKKLRAFGASCNSQKGVQFSLPESTQAASHDGALYGGSPLLSSLSSCCNHSFSDFTSLSRAPPKKAWWLAYDIDPKNGLVKWLGPVIDPHEKESSNNSESRRMMMDRDRRRNRDYDSRDSEWRVRRDSRRDSDYDSRDSDSEWRMRRDSRRDSDYDSSDRARRRRWSLKHRTGNRKEEDDDVGEEEEKPSEFLVVDLLKNRATSEEIQEVTFSEMPRHFVFPFGYLQSRNKTPEKGSYGIAYVISELPGGKLVHRMQFGMFLEANADGSVYTFRAPNPAEASRGAVKISIPGNRFAPAVVDASKGLTIPAVTWEKNDSSPEDASQRKERDSLKKVELGTFMKNRLRGAREGCSKHEFALRLINKFQDTFLKYTRVRNSIFSKNKKEIENEKGKELKEEARKIGGLMKILKAQMKYLSKKVGVTCSRDLKEILEQEKSDRCRLDSIEMTSEYMDSNVRKTILKGSEKEARLAIYSLLHVHSKEDYAKRAGPGVLENLRKCASKILAPSERQTLLPHDIRTEDAASKKAGHGFSAASQKKLLQDCHGTSSDNYALIKVLLKDEKARMGQPDRVAWEEMLEKLSDKDKDSLSCKRSIQDLLRSVHLHSCREVFKKALQKVGPQASHSHSSHVLGQLLSLRIKTLKRKKEHEADADSVGQDPAVVKCFDNLDIPKPLPSALERDESEPPLGVMRREKQSEYEALHSACDFNDNILQQHIIEVGRSLGNDNATRTNTLEQMEKYLDSQESSSEMEACKAQVRLLRSVDVSKA